MGWSHRVHDTWEEGDDEEREALGSGGSDCGAGNDGAGEESWLLPPNERGCTDVPCCALFVISVILAAGLSAWGLATGDVRRLEHGVDFQGNICGVDAAVADRPLLYWCSKNRTADLASPICIASCPGSDYDTVLLCREASGPEGVAYSFTTKLSFGCYCVPDADRHPEAAHGILSGPLSSTAALLGRGFSVTRVARLSVPSSFLATLVAGYFYLVALRCCALQWLRLAALLCAAGLGYLCWELAWWMPGGKAADVLPIGLDSLAPSPSSLPVLSDAIVAAATSAAVAPTLLAERAVAALCGIWATVLLGIVCCLRHRIRVALACLEVTCDALWTLPSLWLVPLFRSAASVGVLLALFAVLLPLCSVLVHVAAPSDGAHDAVREWQLGGVPHACALMLVIFVACWLFAFVGGLSQFAVAYVLADYYCAPCDLDGDKELPCCAAAMGFRVAVTCHIGSIALGSLMVVTLPVVQLLLRLPRQKNLLEEYNDVAFCMLSCCSCAIDRCDSAVELFSRNAYIDMAVSATGFCESARQASDRIVRRGGPLVLLNGATHLVMIVAATAMVMGSCLASRLLCSPQGMAHLHITPAFYEGSPAMSLVGAGGCAFLVSLSFVDLVDVACDSLLYCYFRDLCAGRSGYTAPRPLRDLVHTAEMMLYLRSFTCRLPVKALASASRMVGRFSAKPHPASLVAAFPSDGVVTRW